MGVFTTLSHDDILSVLSHYPPCRLIQITGVPEGTVNTYYRLTTDTGLFYLRIDERGDELAVVHELALLDRLAGHLIPQAHRTTDGKSYRLVKGKPAILFSPLSGAALGLAEWTPDCFVQMGKWLGTMHSVAIPADLFPHRFNPQYLFTIWERLQTQIKTLSPTADALLRDFFSCGWEAYTFPALPQRIIHADLFPENILFEKKEKMWYLSGVLDFEAAGRGPRLLDLAISLHALCFDIDRGAFHIDHARALTRAYLDTACDHMPLTRDERQAWPGLLRYGAVRFLITRLNDFELSPTKNKHEMRKDYREYLDHLACLPALTALV